MIGIMVDLETMGNGPTAAITAIGAADFDSVAGENTRQILHGS